MGWNDLWKKRKADSGDGIDLVGAFGMSCLIRTGRFQIGVLHAVFSCHQGRRPYALHRSLTNNGLTPRTLHLDNRGLIKKRELAEVIKPRTAIGGRVSPITADMFHTNKNARDLHRA
ncbi:hypothetical protein EVAR_37042_1 [Eumeta japonica]|uniref:Uncharacterized protein n=1 Tax=Eumeta variegata TaxID=151549 RepID=A0A4C1WII5_EUMVA|nr:hypothetical protein EVAR_37042_1 [Eumeta japonica]